MKGKKKETKRESAMEVEDASSRYIRTAFLYLGNTQWLMGGATCKRIHKLLIGLGQLAMTVEDACTPEMAYWLNSLRQLAIRNASMNEVSRFGIREKKRLFS